MDAHNLLRQDPYSGFATVDKDVVQSNQDDTLEAPSIRQLQSVN